MSKTANIPFETNFFHSPGRWWQSSGGKAHQTGYRSLLLRKECRLFQHLAEPEAAGAAGD